MNHKAAQLIEIYRYLVLNHKAHQIRYEYAVGYLPPLDSHLAALKVSQFQALTAAAQALL